MFKNSESNMAVMEKSRVVIQIQRELLFRFQNLKYGDRSIIWAMLDPQIMQHYVYLSS